MAISAVNNTYGIGVNPEIVKDLCDSLQRFLAHLEAGDHLRVGATAIPWNSTVLFAKATIEKAKLL